MAESIKASDINAAIKTKFSGDQWRVWFEVSQSTGAYSGRRADAVAMNIWPSKGFQINVFEVKVSRADFKNEVADLTKWRAIGKFADFFWLACPCGLIDPGEVPQDWGLMELTKSGLRIKKQAPALSPESLDRGFAASLLRAGRDLTEERISALADERAASEIASIREAERKRFDNLIAQHKNRADRLECWVKEFRANFGDINTHQPPEKMAERLKVAISLQRGSFQSIATQARALADQIDAMDAPLPQQNPSSQ